jgi:hypothetical protein
VASGANGRSTNERAAGSGASVVVVVVGASVVVVVVGASVVVVVVVGASVVVVVVVGASVVVVVVVVVGATVVVVVVVGAAGVTVALAVDTTPSATSLRAVTRKRYVVALANPVTVAEVSADVPSTNVLHVVSSIEYSTT